MPALVLQESIEACHAVIHRFLNASATASMIDALDDRPALIRKGEHGLYATNPGDQFIVARGMCNSTYSFWVNDSYMSRLADDPRPP